MKKQYLILAAFLLAITAYGQDELYLLDGDTLKGDITILYPEDLFEEIVFEQSGDKKRMKAYEFKGFSSEGEQYKSIKSGDKYRIMKLVEPGYLSIYRFRLDKSYTFNSLYLFRRDGQGQEVPGMLFKKTMMNFMSDCNAVEAALKDGKYKKRDVEELVADYNACIVSKTNAQMAESNKKPVMQPSDPDSSLGIAEKLAGEARSIGDDELESMLNDVANKLREGSEIPSYLKKALSSHIDESHELYDQITALLAAI